MTDVLSQDEIDTLLSAMTSGEVAPDTLLQTKEQKKIKIYDFRRPDKFSKDQLRTLQMMHETFARLTTTSLSAQLRAMVSVHVSSVDQLTYDEFVRSIPNPTTLAIVNMDPLKGSAILEIDPSITFTIIDSLFGGKGEPLKISRELTDIEMAVMEGIIVRILGNLRESWSNVIDLRPRLGNIETKVAEAEGMLNLCIPYITIEPIIGKLSAQYWYSSVKRGQTMEYASLIKDRLSIVYLPVICEIGTSEITLRDLLNLQKGDVIKLNTRISEDFILKVGKRKKFKCRPGTLGKRIAVQIGEKLEEVPEELLKSVREEEEL